MKIFRTIAALLGLLLLPSFAFAQGALLQAVPVTAGHVPMYVTQGTGQAVVQDAGGAGGGGPGVGLSEMSLTARGTGTPPYIGQGTGPLGTNFCDYDAPTTNPTGYSYLCLGFGSGSTLIAAGTIGSTPQLPLVFNVNGTAYSFPFTTGGILGPSMSTVGHVALWNNTVGTLLSDGGFGFTAGTTGQLGYWSSGTNLGGLNIGTGLAVGGSALNLQPAQPAVIGGIESLTCAAHMWLYTISTAGVPSCSQPNFADISGTLAPSQCPNGTSAATGCLQGDGSTLTITGGVIKVTTATTSQLGAVKPDGASITISGGVISTNNGAIIAPQAGRFLPILSAGGCSASSPFTCMQFCQYNGNQILVNGVFVTIPSGQCVNSGGVIGAYNNACVENASFVTTCAQTLAGNTLYYAYVGMVSNTLTMVWSTNTHSPSLGTSTSAYGNEIMTGDATRSLVGMCYTNSSGEFVGTASQQDCSSWFNKVRDGLQVAVTGNFATGSYTDINAADHLTYTQFSDDVPTLISNCVLELATGGPINPTIGIGVSATGTAATLPATISQITVDSSTTLRQATVQQSGAIGSEGYVIANLLGLSQSSIQVNVSSCTLGLASRDPS